MSRKERERLEVCARVKSKQITRVKAAELLKLSYRQMLRVYQRYAKSGAAGLVHGLRGKASNHGCPSQQRQAVLAAYRQHYDDFGPTLAAEQMRARQKLAVDPETLRRWLMGAGLWKGQRRRQKHRSRRERKPHRGELVQLDGSPHAWLEERGPTMSLIEFVDDATGVSYGRFYPEETTEAVMDCLGRYIGRYGLPRSLYVDKDSIYVVNNREPTAQEILEHREPQTQFGRAAAELGVAISVANSPQAKGRVERVHGTHQDRLVKLLRLERIGTMAAANQYLEQQYWQAYNQQFARPAAQAADLHRKVPQGVDLEQVLCLKEQRTVGRDWCVCYGKRVLQIDAKHQSLALAGQRLAVHEHLDGSIQVWFRGRVLEHRELAVAAATAQPKPQPPFRNRKPYKPGADHPYGYRRQTLRRGAGVQGSSAAPPSPGPQHREHVTVLSS